MQACQLMGETFNRVFLFTIVQKCATGQSAWAWNEQRGMFYFHNFLPEMPDLNLENAVVQKHLNASFFTIQISFLHSKCDKKMARLGIYIFKSFFLKPKCELIKPVLPYSAQLGIFLLVSHHS